MEPPENPDRFRWRSVVFLVGGLAPIERMRKNSAKMRTIMGTVLPGAVIIIVPPACASQGIIASAARPSTAQRLTRKWLEPESELTVNRVTVYGSGFAVDVTGEGTLPSIGALESDLEGEFNEDVTQAAEYFPSQILTSDGQ